MSKEYLFLFGDDILCQDWDHSVDLIASDQDWIWPDKVIEIDLEAGTSADLTWKFQSAVEDLIEERRAQAEHERIEGMLLHV